MPYLTQSLDNYEQLICLNAYEEPVSQLFMLEETGHLVSKSSEGDLFFWDYPQSKIVKVTAREVRKSDKRRKKFCVFALWMSCK